MQEYYNLFNFKEAKKWNKIARHIKNAGNISPVGQEYYNLFNFKEA